MVKVSICGSGIVGTATGLGLLKLGNQVIFHDISKRTIRKLRESYSVNATSKIEDAILVSDISFVCVPTPVTRKGMDLSYVKAAVTDIGLCLKKKKGYHLVVIKSTVVPTATEKVLIPLLENVSKKQVGRQIGACVNPEFLTEIHGTWTNDQKFSRDFLTEDRIIIGELDRKSGKLLEILYEPLGIQIIRTDLRTAEFIKFACNCALASRISYWNEIFYICQKLGINSEIVANAAALDERIGEYGTVHGRAFGGKCLPKDLKALIKFSEGLGYHAKLLRAVEQINEKIKCDRGVRE